MLASEGIGCGGSEVASTARLAVAGGVASAALVWSSCWDEAAAPYTAVESDPPKGPDCTTVAGALAGSYEGLPFDAMVTTAETDAAIASSGDMDKDGRLAGGTVGALPEAGLDARLPDPDMAAVGYAGSDVITGPELCGSICSYCLARYARIALRSMKDASFSRIRFSRSSRTLAARVGPTAPPIP